MVSINHILCAVDFSEFSRDALHHGLVLADWYSAQLTVLHVYQADRPLLGLPGEAFLPPVDSEQALRHVQQFSAPLLEARGRAAEFTVREGAAAREIIHEAERLSADLLILGTHGRSGFERLFLGSVTEKVIRSTRIPVLTIPPPVRELGSPLFRTILCAMDFSSASLRALEYALSLAKEADARLILLHVVEEVPGPAEDEAIKHLNASEYYRYAAEDARARLERVLPEDARVWCRPDERVVTGRPHEAILKTVADEGVDLVVMGVQGRAAVNQWVFGSTTHRIIREAGCPVLTLRSGALTT